MKLSKLSLLLLSLCTAVCCNLQAIYYDRCILDILEDTRGYLEFTNGYRHDNITTIGYHRHPFFGLIGRDEIKGKNISSYQMGFKGKWIWYGVQLHVEGDVGFAGRGRFSRTFSLRRVSHIEVESIAHKPITSDFTIDGGYLYDFCNGWSVGPVGGWSYHHQQFRSSRRKNHHHHHHSSSSSSNHSHSHHLNHHNSFLRFGDLSYKTMWQGPYAGIDVAYEACTYSVDFGYEYHWAHWHDGLKRKRRRRHHHHSQPLPQAQAQLGQSGRGRNNSGSSRGSSSSSSHSSGHHHHNHFTLHRHSDDAHGQVAYVNVRWKYCGGWNVGFGLKYQHWTAHNGKKNRRISVASGSSTDRNKVKSATWNSFAATFDLGYTF